MILVVLLLILIYLAIFALIIVSMWKVFTKAQKPGWACIVPIYNYIVMLEIAKKPVWWIALFLIPIANIVFMIMTMNAIAKNFGKNEGFTVGLIFLPFVFWPILGLGDARYIDNTDQPTNSDLLDA